MTSPHPSSLQLASALRDYGLLPSSDEEVVPVLVRLFGDAPPDPLGHSKLLYLTRAYDMRESAASKDRLPNRVFHWMGDDFNWFSHLNDALQGEPLRVMRISGGNDDIGVRILRGADAQEQLEARGADAYQADYAPDDLDEGAWDDEEPEEASDEEEDTFWLSADNDPSWRLASHVDRELLACGSSRRLYILGAWGQHRDGRHDMMLLGSADLAVALEGVGCLMAPALKVSILAPPPLEVRWPFDPDASPQRKKKKGAPR